MDVVGSACAAHPRANVTRIAATHIRQRARQRMDVPSGDHSAPARRTGASAKSFRLHPGPLRWRMRSEAPRMLARATVSLAALALLAALPASADLVDSDLAAAQNGGGCYPTGLHPGLFDMITLVNPEWAPLVDGAVVDSEPVLVHATATGMHGDTGGDFPATHVRSDVNYFLQVDPADEHFLATGNGGNLGWEWEGGLLPGWAGAGGGDRVVALGRWIFDCGHPGPTAGFCSQTTTQACAIDADCRAPSCPTCGGTEKCTNQHWGYSSELHPPYAEAVIRRGRGAVLMRSRAPRAVPVTRADILLSPLAGGARRRRLP